ncbi:23S rRNA (guanine745-N1)-methyltransferase [Arthrobacter woluwensis]|uniref:methyltransferase domain-containing protein n=1 Tax=Arthrobacter woluwensis TaxID=156980 RepID=UPI00278A65D3|nr:methyltransferase domain-containing protein [Arthrobacter woluwensis]MDQ0708758.1 23S rRNA (guanine745-N1)-methyltransferase [Arthrobacter woluwensis]
MQASPAPGSRLRCPSGHSFDAAKQGYYNFLTGKGTSFTADSAAMAASRATFLEAGHYEPLAEALSGMVRSALPYDAGAPVVVDAGAGTGYYLHEVTTRLTAEASGTAMPSAVAFDISKFALRRAARLNPDAAVFVWDVWRPLPLADESADAVLVVFAPRNPAEFRRVLRPGGVAVVVTPLPSHLREIADVAGLLDIEEGKTERLDAGMAEDFELMDRRTLEFALSLSPADVAAVALMGPAGHHLDPAALAVRTAALGAETPVTAGFTLSAYRPLPA